MSPSFTGEVAMDTSSARRPCPCAQHPDTRTELVENTAHNSGRQHMLTITANTADAPARRPAIGTLRLRLKPAHRACGFVQGAWWPRSTELVSEILLTSGSTLVTVRLNRQRALPRK